MGLKEEGIFSHTFELAERGSTRAGIAWGGFQRGGSRVSDWISGGHVAAWQRLRHGGEVSSV